MALSDDYDDDDDILHLYSAVYNLSWCVAALSAVLGKQVCVVLLSQ